MRFTTEEVAAATDGRVVGDDVAVDGVAIDSRLVAAGALFVPIVADRDGHGFIETAVEAGAAAYLTSGGPVDVTATAVEVDDTTEALWRIGAEARRRLPDRVVGVTGSVGKTSTKDLLAAVLGRRWTTTANERSFNNELGVPLTLACAHDETEATVVEMGARGEGHIALLCELARPTVAIVTVVEGAHLELFGSIEAIAAAKAELVEALPVHGAAVLNADAPLVAAMAHRTRASVARFGVEAIDVDVRAEHVDLDSELRASFQLASAWGRRHVRLASRGRHQVTNALAAATAGLLLDVDIDDVVEALGEAELSPHRMDLKVTPAGVRVLNDAYNANPASMRAALTALCALPAKRHFAVLGVMAELGPEGGREHLAIAREAAADGVTIVAVGAADYGPEVMHVADVSAALALLESEGLGEGDAVLVKASRVAALERLAEELHRAGC